MKHLRETEEARRLKIQHEIKKADSAVKNLKAYQAQLQDQLAERDGTKASEQAEYHKRLNSMSDSEFARHSAELDGESRAEQAEKSGVSLTRGR